MEYRKLISFGKSSFVVSLPKSWVNRQKLKKGDLIYINENKNDLVLQPRQITNGDEEKEITIMIDGKDSKRIQRETISAYVQNHKTIILKGNEIKDKAKEIKSFIQKLVALEVMEQDSKKIVMKDFLNMKDISMEQIIRKMDVITRSMLSDCKQMFKENNHESIYNRDDDVNKFRFLISRMIWYGMENPSLILKKYDLKQMELFNIWWLSFSLEQIADHVKRISRHMKDVKLSAKSQTEFVELLDKIEKVYVDILKAYYTNNVEVAHTIANERTEILGLCDQFYLKNRDANFVGYLIYDTKSLIVNISTIGRIVYQGIAV